MARKYATVDPQIWNQPEFRRLTEDAQRLFFYVTTCPSSEGNAYVLPMMMLCEDLHWDIGRIDRAFKSLSVKPFALYDGAARLVYLADYWIDGRNKIPNGNVAAYIARHLYRLPNSALKARAVADLLATKWFADRVEPVFANWRYIPVAGDEGEDSRQGSLLAMPASAPAQLPAPAKPKPAPRPKREATAITKDWEPTDEMRAYACEKGFLGQAIIPEIVKFVRYYTSADCPTPTRKDWLRSWQNWIDKATERKPMNGSKGNGAHAHTGEATLGAVDWAYRMSLYNGPKHVWLGAWGPKPGEPHCEVPPEFLAPD